MVIVKPSEIMHHDDVAAMRTTVDIVEVLVLKYFKVVWGRIILLQADA
jgi:hypothetical protein